MLLRCPLGCCECSWVLYVSAIVWAQTRYRECSRCGMAMQGTEVQPADQHEVHHEGHYEVWHPQEQSGQQQGCFAHGQCCKQQGSQPSPHTPFRSAILVPADPVGFQYCCLVLCITFYAGQAVAWVCCCKHRGALGICWLSSAVHRFA